MMRSNISLVFMLLLGCGPGSPSSGDDDTSDGETTTECEPFSGTVPPIDTPDTCEAYLGVDESSGTEIEVVITNARDEAILLMSQGQGCPAPERWFSVDGEFQGHAVWLPTDVCEDVWPSCRSFAQDLPSCELCGALRSPIYIEPGGRYVTTWTSVVALEVEFPAACTLHGEAVQCWATTALPPGTVQLRAVAGLASDCVSADCSCEVDENGSCDAPDFPSESDLEATLEWSSECDVIELTFDD